MLRRIISLALLALPALTAYGQEAYLVKDINSSKSESFFSSAPANFTRFGAKVYFGATSLGGQQLFATDGTAAGVQQISSINSALGSAAPSRLTVLNGNLLFNATDKAHGEELWITDGTTGGTRLLADINSNPGAPSTPGDRIVFHGSMIFSAYDPADGNELWITDGTGAGTRLFKDLVPGIQSSDPSSFTLLGNTIYFTTSSGLWKSDGTPDGTVLVATVNFPKGLVVSGNKLFFSASTTESGYEPWVSDGTAAGTRMIADLRPGTNGSMNSTNLTPFRDGVLFFAADAQGEMAVWFSDGTAGQTRRIATVAHLWSSTAAVIGDQAYFSTATDLWKTDGTEQGTVAVRLPDGKPLQQTFALTPANGLLYFGISGYANQTLWVSDGTGAGTRQVKTSSPLFLPSNPSVTNIDGTIYFSGANQLNGYEPWKSDGTDAGTVMIANVAPDATPSSRPTGLVAAGDWIYFNAADGSDALPPITVDLPFSLWRSDGTPEGTIRISDRPGSSFVTTGHVGYYYSYDPYESWTTDGTSAGTMRATSFAQRFPRPAAVMFASGDLVLVGVWNATVTSKELWATSTANGSAVRLGPVNPTGFTNVAGRIFFFSENAIWVTDGTPDGTRQVITSPGRPAPPPPAAMGGNLYYSATVNNTAALCRTDGKPDGTLVIKTLPDIAALLTPAGRKLFFTAGGALWVTDGTTDGTQSLGVKTGEIAAAGERVVFVATDAANGTELWVSDGTVAGTQLLRDIRPGAASSTPSSLTTVGGSVYFAGSDTVYGTEMWVTDGTPAGTRLVADIEPGPTASAPNNLTVAGDRLFFSASTTATGRELWVLPLPAQFAAADIHVAEQGGTAHFTVSLSHALPTTVTVDYATADSTATAGSDYDAAAGTLTFAPGETSKTVDVRVRGDEAMENDEAFFLTLRNASGAGIATPVAAAVIVDDDTKVDLAASLDFSDLAKGTIGLVARNNSPRLATGLHISTTETPAGYDRFVCTCVVEVAAGASATVTRFSPMLPQQYVTATVRASQIDPNPADNSVGWTAAIGVAMDALYVTRGGEANIWFAPPATGTYTITSSDPSIVSVPASISATYGTPAKFVARGLARGTATVRIALGASAPLTLDVAVADPGTTPRWPAGIVFTPYMPQRITDSFVVVVAASAVAPYTGEKPTGRVTAKSGGQEIAHLMLDGSGNQSLNGYLGAIGNQTVTIDYEGDRNFLPFSTTATASPTAGVPTVLAGAARSGTSAILRVRVVGSPAATPTGTVTARDVDGSLGTVKATLVESTPGTGEAVFTFTNVAPGPHTWSVSYSGDSHYLVGGQSARIIEARRRAGHP